MSRNRLTPHTPFLRETGYPPLHVALDHPRQAGELLRVFLRQGVFETFLRNDLPSFRFILNSVDSVEVTPSAVVLRGRGYHRRPGHSSTHATG